MAPSNLPPVTTWVIRAAVKLFCTNSIVYCDLFNSSGKAQGGGGEKAEQGIRSLKIAPRHRGLERKRLAVLHHHSAGRFFLSVLLSHTLLMFLSAVQSRGCSDIVSLGQHFKELPESGLAGCPPTIGRLFLHVLNAFGCMSPLRPRGQRVGSTQARVGTATDTPPQTREDQHVCIGSANQCLRPQAQICVWIHRGRQEGRSGNVRRCYVRSEVCSPSIRGCCDDAFLS